MLSQTETIHEDPSIGNDDQTNDSVTATTLRLRLTRKLSNTSNRNVVDSSTTNTTNTGGLTRRRVSWTTETVDNEFLNKKKSKCCCVYQKPRSWNESSSEDENEDHDCQNCRGHRKKDFNKNKLYKDKRQELEEQQATEENNETATVCSDLKKITISNTDSPCSSHSNTNHDQNNSNMNH